MSEEHDDQEPVLESNIERLLLHAHAPPRIDDDAKARIFETLRDRPSVAPPEPEAIHAPAAKGRTGWRGPWPALGLVAAAAAVFGLLWFASVGPQLPGNESQWALHENGGHDAMLVTLEDGSTAILRAGARLQELGPRRARLIAGEALLDVVKGATPFVLDTPHGELGVLGTRFLVRTEDESVLAAVLRGVVELRPRVGDNTAVRAGEAGRLQSAGTAEIAQTKRLSHELAWARELLAADASLPRPVRRGNLVARNPNWRWPGGEWPLPVRSMKVDVYIEDGVARTTIDQTFFNHVNQQLEGVYTFPLPPDAAIARLAMYVDGKRMEAGIVERQRGRDVYESIVYRRRDPALLEWMQGNTFRVRIFPLPPRTEKRIVLSYTQSLEEFYGGHDLRVPIPEIDLPVGEFDIEVRVADGDAWTLTPTSHALETTLETKPQGEGAFRVGRLHGTNVEIGRDLSLRVTPVGAANSSGGARLVSKSSPELDYFMLRARPDLAGESRHVARRWVVLHDTSASRSPAELRAQSFFLRRMVGELDENDQLAVLAFDTTVRGPRTLERVGDIDLDALSKRLDLEGRHHVGETDLASALDSALSILASDESDGEAHVLYLGDGMTSAQEPQRLAALRSRVEGHANFVAVAIGDEVDATLLRGLAEATDGAFVSVDPGEDLAWRALDLVASLHGSRVHGLEVELRDESGSTIDVPISLSRESLGQGEGTTVLLRAEKAPVEIELKGTLHGEPWRQILAVERGRDDAGYLPRLWARARIAALVEDGLTLGDAKAEITRLGLEHFLVTPTTSLLVLENEAMYKQFSVARPKPNGWARYDAPAEIEVNRDVSPAALEPGTHVVRTPVDVLGNPHGTADAFATNFLSRQLGGARMPSGTIGLGGLGLVGTGRGGGGVGSGYGRGSGAGFGGRSAVSDRSRAEAAGVLGSLRGTWDIGDALAQVPDGKQVATVFTDLPTAPMHWSTQPRGKFAKTKGFRAQFGARGNRRSANLGGLSYVQGARPYAQRLHYAGAPELDDVTEFLPAIFEDQFDLERDRLLFANAERERGSMTDEAKELLERARARAQSGRFRLPSGHVIDIHDDDSFSAVRDGADWLREELRYDGHDLVAAYPGIELAVRRKIAAASPALLANWTPWRLAKPEHLARWYDVQKTGERELTLGLPQVVGGPNHRIVVRLDEKDRVHRITRFEGAENIDEMVFEYAEDRISLLAGGQTLVAERLGEDQRINSAVAKTWTTVDLPLRPPEDHTKALESLTVGTTVWAHAQRQHMASLVALHRSGEVVAPLRALSSEGLLTTGDVALASAAAASLDAPLLAEMSAALGKNPVLDYVTSARDLRTRGQTSGLERLAKSERGSVVGMLSRYRLGLQQAHTKSGRAHIRAFLDEYDHPVFAYVLVSNATGRMWSDHAGAGKLWRALADRHPQWRVMALHAAGQAAYNHGRYDGARSEFEDMLSAARELGEPPIFDWTVRSAFQMAGGEPAWRARWSRWRAQVMKERDPEGLMAYALAAQQMGEGHDIHRVVALLEPDDLDAARSTAFSDLLMQQGQVAPARRIVEAALEKAPDDVDLHLRLAAIAETQGRLAQADETLAEVLELLADEEIDLEFLRAIQRRRFDLRSRSSHASSDPGAVDAALEVAIQWRAEDPDNPEIDEACAALLHAHDRPEEAWRFLSSIAERHPGDGTAISRMAGALEKEARFKEADALWARAIEAEPTNPTWLLRRAQNLHVLGDSAQARSLLKRIRTGDWQDRFSNIPWQANALEPALEDE